MSTKNYNKKCNTSVGAIFIENEEEHQIERNKVKNFIREVYGKEEYEEVWENIIYKIIQKVKELLYNSRTVNIEGISKKNKK